jgi:hypothetical protein
LKEKVSAPVEKTENTTVGIRYAYHATTSIRDIRLQLRRQAAVSRSPRNFILVLCPHFRRTTEGNHGKFQSMACEMLTQYLPNMKQLF